MRIKERIPGLKKDKEVVLHHQNLTVLEVVNHLVEGLILMVLEVALQHEEGRLQEEIVKAVKVEKDQEAHRHLVQEAVLHQVQEMFVGKVQEGVEMVKEVALLHQAQAQEAALGMDLGEAHHHRAQELEMVPEMVPEMVLGVVLGVVLPRQAQEAVEVEVKAVEVKAVEVKAVEEAVHAIQEMFLEEALHRLVLEMDLKEAHHHLGPEDQMAHHRQRMDLEEALHHQRTGLKEALRHQTQEGDQVVHPKVQSPVQLTPMIINLVGVIETARLCVHHHLNSIVESQHHLQGANHPHQGNRSPCHLHQENSKPHGMETRGRHHTSLPRVSRHHGKSENVKPHQVDYQTIRQCQMSLLPKLAAAPLHLLSTLLLSQHHQAQCQSFPESLVDWMPVTSLLLFSGRFALLLPGFLILSF
ncbi:hypothetical protein TWF481_001843 [Arthrobotrys musiformis]|uniref:Uncharacterized protein n=1 Tax=Arthrobotrys musiformis TaxID=47236 RepID=A0AAV9VWG6_9PEZI